MADSSNEIVSSRFDCPKSVIILCLSYGIVLGLHYSMLVAKPLYITEDLKFGRGIGLFFSHFPAGVRLMGGIIAAILADSYFGKYNVMATSYTLVFLIPGTLTIVSSWHSFDLKTRRIVFILEVVLDLLVGFGTVVHPAFIAEQFKMPQQEVALQTFYLFDYFYYNVCVAILEIVMLEYTFEMSCFGAPKCYQLLFISYYLAYGAATLIFIVMKKWYIIRMPQRSVMKDMICCIWTALKNRRKLKNSVQYQHKHWLDWADCFDEKWRDDLRRVGKMLTMLFSYFVYYFLYSQMNTMWIYQACRLDGRITEHWIMKPSQVEALNPIVIIIVAPLVEFVLYPYFEKIKFLHTPLQRIGLAYFLTIVAFIMAAVLQIYVEKYGSPLFTDGKAQFRIFNCLNHEVGVVSKWTSGHVPPFHVRQALEIDADGKVSTKMSINLPNGTWSGTVTAEEGKGTNYVISEIGVFRLSEQLDSTLLTSLRPSLLVICSSNCKGMFHIEFSDKYKTEFYNLKDYRNSAFTITLQSVGEGKFFIDSDMLGEVKIRDGGLYGAVIFYEKNDEKPIINLHTLIKPNYLSIMWIFPQYVTITISEIFLYVATNMFVYTQSPPSMRSIVRGLFTAGNSLAQMTLGAVALIHVPEVIWFFSLSGLLSLALIVHIIMARRYDYQMAYDDD